MRRRCTWLLLGVLCLAVAPARAQSSDDARYLALNLALARDYLLPRYQDLAEATQRQRQSWEDFCARPTADGFAQVQASFQAAMDAWIPVQHVRTGPAAQESRIERFYFWPERKNAVPKQVAAVLGAADLAALEPAKLAAASVAIQGLPALQLLLYDGDDPAKPFLAGDPAAAFRCAYGAAIAGNLTEIAGQLVDGWNAEIAAMASGADPFGPPKKTTQLLLTDLLTLFRMVGDFKLAVPLGTSIETSRPKLAESWRSGRSLRNIELNLASARAMYGGDPKRGFRSLLPASYDNDTLDKLLTGTFDDVAAALAAVPLPVDAAVADPAGRPQVRALLTEVRRLRDLVGHRLAPAIGLTMGFNALDGD